MFVHEQIMGAMGAIQQKHGLTKEEVVAEMGQAIHVMLTLNHQDIGAILKTVLDVKPEGQP